MKQIVNVAAQLEYNNKIKTELRTCYQAMKNDPANINLLYDYVGKLSSTIETLLDNNIKTIQYITQFYDDGK